MAKKAVQATRPEVKPPGERRFLLKLLAAALLVRVVFLVAAAGTPMFQSPGVDERWHDQWANELLDNHWTYDQVYFRAPGYPYFLAGLHALSGRSIPFARAVQLVISACSVLLLYLLALRLFDRRTARVAAAFMCIYGTLIFYEQALLIPVLIVFLDLLLLYLLARYREAGHGLILAAAGLVSGLSLIARPNLAVFVGGVGIWLFWRSRRAAWWPRLQPALIYWGLAILPVLPVAWHNYDHSGDFIPVASQGGINFYLGNNPVADGLTMKMPEVELDESIPWNEFVPTTDSIARDLAGKPLSPGEISSFWAGKFLAYVWQQPFDFAAGLARKTYFFFAGVENSDNFDLYFYRELNPVYAALVWRWGLHFPFGLVAPLALIGGILLWARRKDLLLLYLFLFAYIPTVIGVLVTARHRLPVIPILLLFAAYGAFELYRRLRAGPWRARVFWGSLAVLYFVVTNVELFGVGFENRQQSHVNLALAYERLGETEPMVRHLDSALALDSNSVLALNNRAVAFMNEGDLYMARTLLSRALARAPNDPEVTNNLATVMVRQGVDEGALIMFRQVAHQRPHWAEPMYSIATIWAGRDQSDSALHYYDRALARDPYYVQALNDKGSLYQKRGHDVRARLEWRRAFEISPDYTTAGLNLVRSYLEAGLRDSAKSVLRRSEEPWRYSPEWYFYYALTALASADLAHAKELLEEMQQRHPGHTLTTSLTRKLGAM